MRVSDSVRCEGFPCTDVKHECYAVPEIEIEPETVSIVMVSEAAPENRADYYYAGGESIFEQTSVQAFQDAGADVSSIRDILGLGVYLTTAVKCGKTGYGIKTATTQECSVLLERELALFPDVKVFMLMGDVASAKDKSREYGSESAIICKNTADWGGCIGRGELEADQVCRP